MARKLHHHDKEEDPAVNIDSLVDVAFLLLIYFLVTTSLQKLEADLTINPPGIPPPSSDLPPPPTITVAIAANGDITATPQDGEPELLDLGNESRQMPQLIEKFQMFSGSSALGDDQPLVIIKPDPSSNHQRFVDVINAAVETNLENISFTLFDEES